jgi:class 3 adenylate cyclase
MVMEEHQASIQEKVSILYAVLPGLNDLSREINDEDFRKFMNNSYATFKSLISLWGGKMNKYMGDSFMATFGIHDSKDNEDLMCTGAAFEILDKVTEMNNNKDFKAPINIRIGIACGNVVLGNVDPDKKGEVIVIGETVSIATRLSDIAENGQLLADENTYENIKARFDCQALEPIPLKGISKPLPVFQIIGKKRPKISLDGQAGRMIHSDMVGRKNEYKMLEQQIKQLINGRGGVVNITGIAGLGKSRLIAELKESELLGNVALFEGRAVSNGHNLSFHPIMQIIRSWAGIREKDTAIDAKAKLYRGISRVHIDANDEIFPFVATMMGYRLEGKALDRIAGIEGDALENLILKSMRDLLSKAASIRPIVIVVEDAHWSDTSSIVVMESLFKLVRKNRLLFINVFRPGYKETGERLLKFLEAEVPDHYTTITIDSLSGEQSGELIDNLLLQTHLPDDIKNLVIERASGNPFFIEEVIRSFIDEGLIEIDEKQFKLTENIKYANIPESIDHVLLSRIERLDDITRNLLKTASVIGRNFYFRVLQEATETIEELDNRLEYLKDIQLLNERKHKDEVEFLFKHALAQQATYESILETSRKELHLKIANSIEKVFAGRIHEFYGTLAHHYGKAMNTEKVKEYLIKAGEESQKSGASSEAVNFFKQAIELLELENSKQSQRKILDLEEKLAFVLEISGNVIDSTKYTNKLIGYHYKPFPKTDLFRIIAHIKNLIKYLRIIYTFKYDPARQSDEFNMKLLKLVLNHSRNLAFVDAKRYFFESFFAVRFIKRKHFGNFEAMTTMSGCGLNFYTGIHINLGKLVVRRCMKYLDERYIQGWLTGKWSIGQHDYFTGQKSHVLDEDKVYRYAIRMGSSFSAQYFFFWCCLSLIEAGDEKNTQYYLKRMLQLAEAFDSNSSLAQHHRLNMTYLLKFRKIDEVLRITDEILDFYRKINLPMYFLSLNAMRSMAFILKLDLNEAEKCLSIAEANADNLGIISLKNMLYLVKCHFEIARYKANTNMKNDEGNMHKYTRKTIKVSRKVKKNLPEAYRLRAIACWLTNKPGKASRNFKKSIDAGLNYDCKLELSRTYFEAGKFLRDQNHKKDRINGMNGTECLMKAKTLFEEMKLDWDLKEYHNAMEGLDS